MKLSNLKLGQSIVVAEKPMSKKKAEDLAEQMFYKHGHGVQINIMNLGKVSQPSEDALMKGLGAKHAEDLMIENIKKYREN